MSLPSSLPTVSQIGNAQGANGGNFIAPPTIAAPFTTIINRAPMVDLSKDLGILFGSNRLMVQSIGRMEDETGPNGEIIFGWNNDPFGQVRFAGNWINQYSPYGSYAFTSVLNDYMEVSFYGTGLNVLTVVDANIRDIRATVDGGVEGANIIPGTAYNGLFGGRGYATNQSYNAAAGLTLGFHTVKLRYVSGINMNIYGFEVLNESSNITVMPGTIYKNGHAIYNPTAQTISPTSNFESGVLGTRGGRVSLYMKSDGTIAKAVTPTNTSVAYLSNADHTNEEIARIYHTKEFGRSGADDFTVATTSPGNKTHTLDDGTTTLGGTNVANYPVSGYFGVGFAGVGSNLIFTFVGTGLDYVDHTLSVAGPSGTVTVDGVSIGSIAQIAGSRRRKIVSGLPYGCHTVTITSTNYNDYIISKFIVYQPKKPTVPADAIELASYNIMANYSIGSGVGVYSGSTGTYQRVPSRDLSYAGTWTISTLNPGIAAGHYDVRPGSNGAYFEHTFTGTGFDIPIRVNSGSASITLTVDGTSNLTGLTINKSASGTFTASTGTYTGAINDGRVGVSGLAHGKHTVRITYNNAASVIYFVGGYEIITPTHSHRNIVGNNYGLATTIGGMAVHDNRRFAPNVEPKNVSQAFGFSSSQSTTYTLNYIGANDLSVAHVSRTGRIKISYAARVTNSSANQDVFGAIEVNGLTVGREKVVGNTSGTATQNEELSDILSLPVGVGVHKIDVTWRVNSGTGTLQGNERNLLVEDI